MSPAVVPASSLLAYGVMPRPSMSRTKQGRYALPKELGDRDKHTCIMRVQECEMPAAFKVGASRAKNQVVVKSIQIDVHWVSW